MAVRILTDSSSDLPFSMQEQWGIDILPLRVLFGDKEYVDGRDLSREEFYTLLSEATELPKTAQITPHEFERAIGRYVEAGDEVVVLGISSELSGTYASALLAREQFPEAPVYVVDSRNVTFALALLVEIAVGLRDRGLGAEEIARTIESLRERVRLYAVIDDLKYLRMGGRLSAAGAVVGSLLGIKPIVTLADGRVESIDKVRGMKAGYQCVLERTEKDGIDTAYPVYFGHSNVPDAMRELQAAAAVRFELDSPRGCGIGPIVGTHAGPGCVGIAFVAK